MQASCIAGSCANTGELDAQKQPVTCEALLQDCWQLVGERLAACGAAGRLAKRWDGVGNKATVRTLRSLQALLQTQPSTLPTPGPSHLPWA